jgi:hypothetical protein
MNETELQNVQASIQQLTAQALSLYYRVQTVMDFVDKKGGLGGASDSAINAYNALSAIHDLVNNQVVAQGDYLSTLTQNTNTPQY